MTYGRPFPSYPVYPNPNSRWYPPVVGAAASAGPLRAPATVDELFMPRPGAPVPASKPVGIAYPDTNPPDPDNNNGRSVTETWVRSLPALLLFGITTGAAFAIGSGLASRYVFGHEKK